MWLLANKNIYSFGRLYGCVGDSRQSSDMCSRLPTFNKRCGTFWEQTVLLYLDSGTSEVDDYLISIDGTPSGLLRMQVDYVTARLVSGARKHRDLTARYQP